MTIGRATQKELDFIDYALKTKDWVRTLMTDEEKAEVETLNKYEFQRGPVKIDTGKLKCWLVRKK